MQGQIGVRAQGGRVLALALKSNIGCRPVGARPPAMGLMAKLLVEFLKHLCRVVGTIRNRSPIGVCAFFVDRNWSAELAAVCSSNFSWARGSWGKPVLCRLAVSAG